VGSRISSSRNSQFAAARWPASTALERENTSPTIAPREPEPRNHSRCRGLSSHHIGGDRLSGPLRRRRAIYPERRQCLHLGRVSEERPRRPNDSLPRGDTINGFLQFATVGDLKPRSTTGVEKLHTSEISGAFIDDNNCTQTRP
jgi:hypothetical protein